VVTVDVLPDDVLLTIFDFHVFGYQNLEFTAIVLGNPDTKRKMESWQSLVHVCRRWRGLVFESPRRLNLELCCTPGRSARMSLDVWPALPLHIMGDVSEISMDDIALKLRHSNRIFQIGLRCYTILQIENVWAAMQVPFPELKVLYLSTIVQSGIMVPALPDSFLGGSAPRLRFLALTSIPFQGLSNLLLSATHLVNLYLYNIPHSGYISPEAMATCLSMLTSLEELQLGFESPQSCPDQENRLSPPPTRSTLPTLTFFWFKGVHEYLEDLVSRIDSPRLDQLSTTFFNDIDYNTPEFNQFVSRTPTLGAYNEARLIFHSHEALVSLHQSQSEQSDHRTDRTVEVKILCQVSDGQLSSLAQICTLSSHLFSIIENLYIYEDLDSPDSPPNWKGDIENTEWLDLLLPFTAVKNLYLSEEFSPRIAPALQELTGVRITEVLPALQNVLLDGFHPLVPVQEGIAQFISARQLTNHPVAISVWDRSLVWDRS
jgi:F-box-like